MVYTMDRGCGCNSMSAKMNNWGVAGCKSNMHVIVEHIVNQLQKNNNRTQFIATHMKPITRLGIKSVVACVVHLEAKRVEKINRKIRSYNRIE